MNSKHLAAFAAVAALAVPTAAIADSGHGKSDEAKAKQEASTNKGQSKLKNAVFKGSVVSTDSTAGTITIHVDKANRWGRRFKGTDVTFTVAAGKYVNVLDTNTDGKKDLLDVKAGDKAKAQARITKTATNPFAARKLYVRAPETGD